jgi:hypothetical protein
LSELQYLPNENNDLYHPQKHAKHFSYHDYALEQSEPAHIISVVNGLAHKQWQKREYELKTVSNTQLVGEVPDRQNAE